MLFIVPWQHLIFEVLMTARVAAARSAGAYQSSNH
jgi:hypothetical protein